MRPILVAILVTIILSGTPAWAWKNLERVAAIYIVIDDQVTDGCWPRPQATKEAVELVFRQAGIIIAESSDEEYELSWPPGYLPVDKFQFNESKLQLSLIKQDEMTKEVQELKDNLKAMEEMGEEQKAAMFYKFSPHVLTIEALGYLHADLVCAVSVEISLSRSETLQKWQWYLFGRDFLSELGNASRPHARVDYGSRSYLTTGGKSIMQTSITDAAVEQATSLANAILKARTEYGLTTRK